MREPVEWPTRDLLSHRVAATPERTAVVDVDTDREWTYRSFDALVDAVALQLRDALPTGAGQRVASLVPTSVEFVSVFYAGLRVGAEFVPLNTRLSEREVRSRLQRVDPDLLVCERDTEQVAVAAAACPVVSTDDPDAGADERIRATRGEEMASMEPARWGRDETAVVLFTSGTTGNPKGVRLTHGNLVASATASAFRLGVSPGDRWLCCLPTYHMGGLAPACRCPLYGTTLLVQGGFDAADTADALATLAATGVSLVPTQLTRLLDAGWHPPESLETVLLGGAPATRALVERALERDVPVYPTYGLTETASQVATATPETAREYPESVGPPLVFTEVTVVDGSGEPVERGESGRLAVDGPTVTPGYLDADETASAFDDHGLHTGDVGYLDEGGRLWILGRADETIVTGGENVHPREVASVLRDHPQVADAAVVGLADEEWGERIGALVVADAAETAGEDVEAFARERLAGYKVPKTLAVASELPRTPSGTVDREAVRERLADR